MVETAEQTLIGGRARRLDAGDKLTGKARYATDLTLPGMLYGKIVRSDRPHARILSIDTSAAEALPGVEAVLHGDVTGGRFGEVVKDQTPFALDRVRYIGDPIAAIAADTPETAELAARLIEVEYEDLPAVFDPIEALQPDAPLVHEDIRSYAAPSVLVRYGNVTAQVLLEKGDISAAFANAAHVFEDTYSAHSVHQMSMETRAAVAEVDSKGRLTVHSSTQGPFNVRHQLHEALDMPYGDLRVIAATVGGGFGAKLEAAVEMYAAMLARATGRPVKVANTRDEDLTFGNPRHPMIIHLRTAVAADGTILGREAKTIMDAGAYAGGSPLLAGVAAMLAPGPYRIPNLKVEVLVVHTNKMAFGSYRGPSGPQTVFAVESHTDAIAKQLGMDALEFRFKNILDDGDTGHSGQPLSDVSLRETLLKAAEAIEWGTANPPSAPGLKRGKGLSVAWWLTTAGAAGCSVQMNEDGTVVVHTGATEIGTGSVMAGIAQIVAGEMGIELDDVNMVWGDTATTPMDAGAQGSRTLFNMGQAAKRAAQGARAELMRRAADILEASEADLEVKNGRVSVKGVPDRGVTYADLSAGQMWASEPILANGAFLAETPVYDPATLKGSLFPAFNAPSFHCHAAEVELDPETGSTRIVDYVVAQDAGFAIAPTYVEGQMQGGAIQGVGYMLTEEVAIEDGRMLNPNLALYKLPTTLESPNVRTIIVESASANGPYGAKGVGEPPVVVPPGAIANAVANAIGTPIRTTPLTPERVLRVIRDGESAAAPVLDPAFELRPGDLRTED
ncbi:MAG: xanthine dehydrogenase family protein molybdopterin-binding subunit [Thermomicrobiales bacterium]|nr:xanthine dehydrogenase family protein molybdopterin-binding subunit [Thermomicrobiales bacterium]